MKIILLIVVGGTTIHGDIIMITVMSFLGVICTLNLNNKLKILNLYIIEIIRIFQSVDILLLL